MRPRRRRRWHRRSRLSSQLRQSSGGSWAAVREISDESTNKRAKDPIVFEMNDWLHPEDRAELTDGRAVERLRKDDIDIAS
jgi:hypothetical protein